MYTRTDTIKRNSKPTERTIYHLKANNPQATIVFFCGIHGNETAGVIAIKNILKHISEKAILGDIYAFYGNIEALKQNQRFITKDLNRLWTSKQIENLKSKHNISSEEKEQIELLKLINQVLEGNSKSIYFIDLHTTSSRTLPFITINDALINRKFSKCFPVPIVLGIEEYLEGPLLSYLNTLGYVSLGFEAGQHTDPQAVKNCEAFINLALHYSGILKRDVEKQREELQKASNYLSDLFEVIYKYEIKPEESFKMKLGFKSFENIKRNMDIAISDGKLVKSKFNGKIFMPLYQTSGNDGFFIIKKINPFFLKLSEYLRRFKADNLLTLLPGISWHQKESGVLRANLKIAKFLTKPIFHLFGYRNKQLDKDHLLLYNRERVSKKRMYKEEKWNK